MAGKTVSKRKSVKKSPKSKPKKAPKIKSVKKSPKSKPKKALKSKSVKKSPKSKPVAKPELNNSTNAYFDADIMAKNMKSWDNLLKKISLPEIKGLKKENYARVLKAILTEKIEDLKERKYIPKEWKIDRDTYYFDKNMFKKSFDAVYDNLLLEQEDAENAKKEIGETEQEYAEYRKDLQNNRKMLEKLKSYVQESQNIFENIIDLSLKSYQSRNINDEDELNSIFLMYTIYQGGSKRIDRLIKNKL